jgi:threonyl-tRNA synthetase
MSVSVKLPDGSVKNYSQRMRASDVAADIGPGLAKAAIVAEINGEQRDLSAWLPESGEVALKFLTKKDPESLRVMRHSAAHVMAQAIMRLYKDVQLAFGPTTDNGFYYDMKLGKALGEEDFPAIEAEMAKIIKEAQAFERIDMPREKALQLCNDLLSPGRVSGPLPRPAHSDHRIDRRVQVAERCRRVLERRLEPRTVAATVWHCVV